MRGLMSTGPKSQAYLRRRQERGGVGRERPEPITVLSIQPQAQWVCGAAQVWAHGAAVPRNGGGRFEHESEGARGGPSFDTVRACVRAWT